MPDPMTETVPRTAAEAQAPKRSLQPVDWVDAAIAVMVESSIENVRVEQLASKLGVSKGSFYWHFKDRRELLLTVLDRWTDTATLAVHSRLDKVEPSPAQRVLRFMQLPLRSDAALRAADLELAIIGWARRSSEAREAVAAVDRLRTEHVAGLFRELGIPANEALFRAHQTYAFIRYVAQRRDMSVEERTALTLRMHALLLDGATAP